MKIIQKRKIFFVLSGICLLFSIIFLGTWGLKLGIDFTGGTLMEVAFPENEPDKKIINEQIKKSGVENHTLQETAEKRIIIRFASDSDQANQKISELIKEKYPQAEVERVEFISSVISSELKKKAYYAVIFAIIGIAIYIAWAFKKVSYPVESWKYGLAAVIALAHDVLLTLGIFVFLGKFYGIEVNIPFIAALLTILGYSVNDTIVVFDRIRENLLKSGSKENFEGTVNDSINQTIARSINTSLTVIFVLVAIILFGGESIKIFSLALLAGIVFGTYSSIFVASASLVEFWKHKFKKG